MGQEKSSKLPPYWGRRRGPLRIMKKNYISPLMVEVNVEAAEQMLAGSMRTSEQTIDTRNGGQLGGESRGEWGNLWN